MWPSDSLLLVRMWFSSTNSIDWSLKKEGDFSLARTAVRIAPNRGARPAEVYLHHLIVIDVYAYRAERVAELLDLYGVCRDGHVPLLNVVQLCLLAVVFAAKILCRFSHASFGVLAS